MKSIWSGFIGFGLVNIPVKLYSATKERKFELDMLHNEDLSPIRYARICTYEDKEVSFDQIVRGYQYEKGHYVVLTDEDFQKVDVKRTKSIDVVNFVGEKEIDPIYFSKPYYLEPDGLDKAYYLFLEALKKMGKVAVAKYILRNKEHIAILRPRENILVLDQIRFSDEILDYTELNLPQKIKIDEKELKMASVLMEQITEPFDINKYEDTYNEKLKQVIEQKKQGREPIVREKAPAPTKIPDLMDVLRKSIEAQEKKQKVKG